MDKAENSIRYCLKAAEMAPDGEIIVQLTGWEGSEGRGGGVRRYHAGCPDYGFWRWIVENKARWPETTTNEELEQMRQEYEQGGV